MNHVLQPDDGDYNRNFVGILDIFGFEDFRVSGSLNGVVFASRRVRLCVFCPPTHELLPAQNAALAL